MHSLFLLLTGAVVLFLGNLFLERLQSATLLRPLFDRHHGQSVRHQAQPVPNLVMFCVAVPMCLTWGWAPLFVWIVAGFGCITIIAHGLEQWMVKHSAGTEADTLMNIAGKSASIGANALSLFGVVFWAGITASLLIDILVGKPNLLKLLVGHLLLTASLPVILKTSHHSSLIGYLCGFFLLPLVALAPDLELSIPGSVTVLKAILAMLLIGLIMSAVRYRNSGWLRCSTLLTTGALSFLILVLSIPVLIINPVPGFLSYFSAGPNGTALPLLLVLMPIAGFVIYSGNRSDPVSSGSFTGVIKGNLMAGLFVLSLLILVAVLPELQPNLELQLPDFSKPLEFDVLMMFLIEAAGSMAAFLPISTDSLETFTGFVLVMGAWHCLIGLVSAATSNVNSLGLPIVSGHPGYLAIALGMLLTVGCLLLHRYGLPLDWWVFGGMVTLLLMSVILLSGVFALLRVDRHSTSVLLLALTTSFMIWWVLIVRVTHHFAAGNWLWLTLCVILGAVTAWLHISLSRNFLFLHRFRLAY